MTEPIDTTGFRPAEITDQPQPMMIWAQVADLVIDRSYQRGITVVGRRAIQRIADGWDWRKYQPIIVAPAEGGKLAVVDGQHRAHAAALCGIEAMPAMSVPMTLAEQAAGFAAINRDRVGMSAPQIYRAELAAGREWAVQARDAVAAAPGCELATYTPNADTKQPGVIYAVGLVRKMIEAGEGEAVTAGLAGIRRSQSSPFVESYGGPVLSVWLPAVATNVRFLRADLAAAFDRIDFDDLIDATRREGRQSGVSGRRLAIDRTAEFIRETMVRSAA